MKYLVANWKMKLTIAESVALARAAQEWHPPSAQSAFFLVLCPSPCAIQAVGGIVKGSVIGLGAQDVGEEERASLTGATSPLQLHELGVGTVIVGHSERRMRYGEDDALVHKKVSLSLRAGFRTILCVGEGAVERKRGQAEDVIRRQVRAALQGAPSGDLLIAYEPVWAIGTGKPVGVSEAHACADVIRTEAVPAWGEHGKDIPVLYGGSVDRDNVAAFTADPLDGTLVGNASQTVDGLHGLVEALKNVYDG